MIAIARPLFARLRQFPQFALARYPFVPINLRGLAQLALVRYPLAPFFFCLENGKNGRPGVPRNIRSRQSEGIGREPQESYFPIFV